jgi:hypothetical protein
MKKIIVLSFFVLAFFTAKAETTFHFKPIVSVIDTTFEIYVGVYKLDENGMIDTYTVSLDGGKLYGQANGYDRTELSKQKDPHAFKSGYGSDVIFSQEVYDKPFNKVKLVVQGNTVMGTKQ